MISLIQNINVVPLLSVSDRKQVTISLSKNKDFEMETRTKLRRREWAT